MRVRIRDHDIEGTPEEIAQLLELMPEALARAVEPSTALASKASPFVSEKVAYDVLTRRELGETHVKLLHLLDDAGDEWTTARDLQQALDLSTREFAGALGAFGRRLSHTAGAGTSRFLDQYWDHDNGYNLYRLPPTVRAAVRKAGIVR